MKGQVIISDPSSSKAGQLNLNCILTDYGGWNADIAWSFIKKMHRNGIVISKTLSSTFRDVNNGEYTVGLSTERYAIKQLGGLKNSNCHLIYPSEGIIAKVYGSAILKNTVNLENAKLFVDFIVIYVPLSSQISFE